MYYSNLDQKKVTDNQRFCKTVKPLPSDKLAHKAKINLSENGETLKTDMETANFWTLSSRLLFKILTFLDF